MKLSNFFNGIVLAGLLTSCSTGFSQKTPEPEVNTPPVVTAQKTQNKSTAAQWDYMVDELDYYANDGDTDMVRQIIEKLKTNPYSKTLYVPALSEALIGAATHGHYDTAELLLDKGADGNAGGGFSLIYAAAFGHADIVALLVEHENGADIHAGDDEALIWAVSEGYNDVVKTLLDHGANPLAQDGYALQLAKEEGFTKIVEMLERKISETKQNMQITYKRPGLNGPV